MRFSIGDGTAKRWAGLAAVGLGFAGLLHAQGAAVSNHDVIDNSHGIRMLLVPENVQPAIRIVLPGHPLTDRMIEVLFPEHVTVRQRGNDEVEHIYMWREGRQGEPPVWRLGEQSLAYEKSFPDGIHLLARATLADDGILFHYDFRNGSNTTFNLVWAPVDPRLTSGFHDVRLQRTYVHHKDGWGLLAANTPERLSMPLDQWLPVRYLDAVTRPVLFAPARTYRVAATGQPANSEGRIGLTLLPPRRKLLASPKEEHRAAVIPGRRDGKRPIGKVWIDTIYAAFTSAHTSPEATMAVAAAGGHPGHDSGLSAGHFPGSDREPPGDFHA
jgi:hypothetical protein